MKIHYFKTLLIIIGVFILGIANFALANPPGGFDCEHCPAGGPGTESCEIELVAITYSVSCNDGYYACCNGGGAKCCEGS